MSHEFRAAALALLIPCDVRCESSLLSWLREKLAAMGIAEADQTSWIKAELSRWAGTLEPSAELVRILKLAIYDPTRTPSTFVFASIGDDDEGGRKRAACAHLASQYVNLHRRLQQMMLSHEEARLVLSYAGLMISFAIDHRMSASEMSRILGARDKRLALNWYPIKAVINACRCGQVFGRQEIQRALQETVAAEPVVLADLAIEDAARYVGALGVGIGCQKNLAEALEHLLLGARHDPYLMMLHFQLSILESCDHAITFAYEFSPRGQAADWLVEQYQEAGLDVPGNPFLNNAKALLRFDRSWAWGRADYLRQAHALVTILDETEALGPLPKGELGRYLRALLRRVMRMSSEQQAGLPNSIPDLSEAQASQLFSALAVANTGTNGILEQRMLDAMASVRHSGWAVRGRGDSVFAASTFRKKLGDVEFIQLHGDQPQLFGYESHGGRLTGSYVVSHIASFEAILRMRQEELEAAAPLAEWELNSVFVSHSRDDGLPAQVTLDIGDLQVVLHLHYQSFADMAAEGQAAMHAQSYFIAPLNQYQVPPTVRQRAMDFLAA